MFKKKNAVLLLAMTVAVAACGGSSNVTPTSGQAVDGYLVGSTVLCDVDKDGVADSGEATDVTVDDGNFTFPAGCSDTIVVTGGKDKDTGNAFAGTLKAPAGSKFVTPLTTLLADTDMTPAELATALGLPAETKFTETDPVAPGNEALLKTTLAVQQIIQQLANVFEAEAVSGDISGIYSKVASELAKSMKAPNAPQLISDDGIVNSAAVYVAAGAALELLKADSKFAAITINAENLETAVAQIGAQAQQLASALDADIAKLVLNLQNPVATPIETAGTTKYLALQNDSLKINDVAVPYASLAAGVTIGTPETIGLDFSIIGTPAINTVAKLALELVEVGGQSRVLQLMIDKVNIKNTDGQLSIVPDAGAKVYVFGHAGSGTEFNLTLTDLTFQPLDFADNILTLHYKKMVNTVLASVDNTTKTTAEKFISIKGLFNIKLAVGGLNVRNLNGSALPSTTIVVNNSSPLRSVSGVGVSGKLTIE